MVAYCLACAEPFLRLNQGKIFPLDLGHEGVEYFWLCRDCARLCDIVIRNGSPVVVPTEPEPGRNAA